MGGEDARALKEDTVSKLFSREKGNNYYIFVAVVVLRSGPADRGDASKKQTENVPVCVRQNKKSLNGVTKLE